MMNMENNLYYTPTIEEFHVGFEYEHLSSNLPDINDKFFKPRIYDYSMASLLWERKVIDKEGNLIKELVPAILTVIESEQCRVKYLDQFDIESLVWSFGTNDYVFPENKNVTYGQYKLLFNNSELEIIHLSGTVFRGIIKNKSQLKFIMKCLGILE